MSEQSSQLFRRTVPSGGGTYGRSQAPLHCTAAVEARLGTATGLDDFSRKAQFVTYESHRAMFEARNTRLRPRDEAGGPTPRLSQPAPYSAVWQTYEAVDGDGAYYGARKGCEPVHVQADPVSGRVIAVNRTARPITNATLTAHYYDLDGRRLVPEQRKRVNVGPSATASVFTADRMDSLPPFHLLRLLLEDPLGQVLSENTYWRYREAADMRSLNTARQTRVAAELGAPGRNDGRRTLTASLRNHGTAVAAMVRLCLLDGETGDRVLPTLYGDNYLWLLPGESRTVSLSWPPSALPADHRPKLRLDGYNVPRAYAR
ncbi:hypothetical protein AB0M29_14880 [Streptomyces sp. NPDC051976]|uniref:hypothetical protein n=1 Tax=Streptomyces sp. NPDC051976 TaxID=3154947 RepID=UPI003439AB3A